MQFQSPPSELAVVVRRDSIQHPFLEALYGWGKRVFYYPFGTSLGKDTISVFASSGGRPLDVKDAGAVVAIFREGEQQFREQFKRAVIDDMAKLGYALEDIALEASQLKVDIELPGPLMNISVKEVEISRRIPQHEISQGMFRALSLIIQLNYGAMSGMPSTIIIDDIGEGLDFDRSCALINLVIEKAEHSRVQLIMATNDRFVMNRVPIQAWSVLKRSKNGSLVYNYANSKTVFDNFRFTGLNNFDFLAADFIDNQEPPNE
jgi:energy-coupling factor transporter ATP-binding protein EcfA2